MASHYAEHAQELKRDLAREIPVEALRELHQKRPLLHAFVAFCNFAALIASAAAIVTLDRWYLWLPFAFVAGFAVFNCTVLLHEVVHRAVLREADESRYRFLGLLYAIPSGISSSQFTRWHLDHHAGLGSDEEDPKRHYLSPKINARWLKLLYFTPALFPIYFRAAARETSSYEPALRKRIAGERLGSIAFHLSLLALAWYFGVAFKLYVVPVFFVFPIAFALNRLGQHYDIDPADPANWSTLVKGSWFWDHVFLYSNYHLEHHYFPGVPFYNLPRLQRLLMPFYEARGIVPRTYGELVWRYLILNRKPHTNWSTPVSATGEATASSLPVA
jgi:fatty acid desaturase